MNVVIISRVRMNPYTRLLAGALEEVEPGLQCVHEDSLTPGTVARWRGRADVLHIHWPELLYQSSSPVRSARKLARFLAGLYRARRAGIGLVCTAHNLRRHEDKASLLDALADGALYRLVDAVHVHDEEAQRELTRRRQVRRIAVIPHGNYIGAYPDQCTEEGARQRLGIDPHAFVFLALGQIRPYKGLDDLIAAFRTLPRRDVALLITGHVHDEAYGAVLQAQAAEDPRIRLELRFIPDDEVQYYMRSADVCVLPYRSVTTSGAAILALSFGRPVVAPDLGSFRLLLAQGGGIVYSVERGSLEKALAAAMQMDLARAGAAALATAQSLDWRPIARQHLAVYRTLGRD